MGEFTRTYPVHGRLPSRPPDYQRVARLLTDEELLFEIRDRTPTREWLDALLDEYEARGLPAGDRAPGHE